MCAGPLFETPNLAGYMYVSKQFFITMRNDGKLFKSMESFLNDGKLLKSLQN